MEKSANFYLPGENVFFRHSPPLTATLKKHKLLKTILHFPLYTLSLHYKI